MTDESKVEDEAPEIRTSANEQLTFWQKYKRGCKLFDLATPGMVPFFFLLLSQWVGYFGIVLAVISAFLIPAMSYEIFEYSIHRRIRKWFLTSDVQDSG